MAKQYAIVMNGEHVFGPVSGTEYNKVLQYLNNLQPDQRKLCKVQIIGDVDKKSAPKKDNKLEQPAPIVQKSNSDEFTIDADTVNAFGNFIEGTGQSNYWKPKEGRQLIRFVPIGGVSPIDWKSPFPFISTGVHSNVGATLQDTVYCARQTHGKPCPICAFVAKLYNSKSEDDIIVARKIKGYKRVIANIIDLADIDKGIQKFAFGKKLAAKIQSYLQDEDTKNVLHPENGNNLILIKKTVDKFPNYDESRFEIRPSSLTKLCQNWRKDAHNLIDEIKEKSFDELNAILVETKKALLNNQSTDWTVTPEDQTVNDNPTVNVGSDNITEINPDDLDKALNGL